MCNIQVAHNYYVPSPYISHITLYTLFFLPNFNILTLALFDLLVINHHQQMKTTEAN